MLRLVFRDTLQHEHHKLAVDWAEVVVGDVLDLVVYIVREANGVSRFIGRHGRALLRLDYIMKRLSKTT
jgi:hypothetical protein